MKGKNNCSVTWDGVGTYSESQKTQGSTLWHFNFLQMTKMTTFKNTVADHTELIYTHSLQTPFRNTIVFLCSIPYGTQYLLFVFPYAGCIALSPAAAQGTTQSKPAAQPPQHSYPFTCPGPGVHAVIQSSKVMEAGNCYIKMSILSLQTCLIIVHCKVLQAILHHNWGDHAWGQALCVKCQVSHQENTRRMIPRPLTHA